jgi:hypothetical protein
MKNELKDALNIAFYAPEPKNKQAFLKNIRPREVSIPEMLLQQVRYIRLSVWAISLGFIAFALIGSWMQLPETDELIPVLMPFLAVVSVLENRRSKKFGMTELEMVTRFSLRSVIFARMIILGVAFLLILVITAPVVATAFGGEIIVTAVHILIPYLLTMIISLQVERSSLGRKLEYGSLSVAALISVSTIWMRNLDTALINRYAQIIRNWGFLIVIILAAVTVYEQWRTLRGVEEFA